MTYLYSIGTVESIIDLTFSIPDLIEEIQNWAINEEAHAVSDLKVITFEIQSTRLEIASEPRTQRYN